MDYVLVPEEVWEKLVETNSNLAVEPYKSFDCKWWTIRRWELMEYAREEIEAVHPE